MGLFRSTRTFNTSINSIETIVTDVCESLKNEQFEVQSTLLISGGAVITITKGGMFKAIIGLKTALKINIVPVGNGSINVEADVGIFGQLAIPTVFTMLVAWPVMIPQIWGLIQQSKLDEHVLDLIQQSIDKTKQTPDMQFCPFCGHKMSISDLFCGGCGKKL